MNSAVDLTVAVTRVEADDRLAKPDPTNISGIPHLQPTVHPKSRMSVQRVTLRYEPLDSARSEIRLIEFLPPASAASPIRCRLHKVPLGDDTKYLALSYVWGDDSNPSRIVVDDQEVAVTHNLHQALACLIHFLKEQRWSRIKYIWIDALCINQLDLNEKSEQVSLMSTIYSSAESVLAYLGLGDEKTSLTIETLNNIQDHITESLSGSDKTLKWMKQYPQIGTAAKDKPGDFWQGLNQLMTAQYWSRIWVLQEMVVSRTLVFVTSSNANSWFYFETLAIWHVFMQNVLFQKCFMRPDHVSSLVWTREPLVYCMNASLSVQAVIDCRRRLECKGKPKPRMTDLRHFQHVSLRLCATDPRDKIYGLLALMQLDIKVDYSEDMSVRELYTQFAAMCVQSDECSRILVFSGTGWDKANQFNLPSWVPDWDRLATAAFELTTGAASGPKSLNLQINDRPYTANKEGEVWSTKPMVTPRGTLSTRGCVIEIITTPPLHALGTTEKTGRHMREALFPYCAAYTSTRLKKTSKIPPLQMLFRSLFQDMQPAGSSPGFAGGLYDLGGTSRVITLVQCAINFLACLVDPYLEHADDIVPRLQQLGFKPDEETCLQFYHRTFFADVESTTVMPLLEILFNARVTIEGDMSSPAEVEKMAKYAHSCQFFPATSVASRTQTLTIMQESLANNCILETADGGLALVPPGTAVGDVICVLAHCNYPVVLRKVDGGWRHIGVCFVLGLIDGEAAEMIESGRTKLQDFELI